MQDQDYTPVLRFAVCSDVHIRQADDLYCARLRAQMRCVYAIAAADDNYKKVDAFLIAGDATERGEPEQYAAFAECVRAELRGDTQMRAVVAKNHDNWTGAGKDGLDFYREATGNPTDFHLCLNGFHFLGVSTCGAAGEYYAPEQREWLSAELQSCAAEDRVKPIFVLHHEHVKDTVWGSTDTDGWGIAYFKDIFVQYPQIEHLSGHSHYPLNDPRSVYQREFTAIGTGALSYAELTVDGQNKIRPADKGEINEGWIVEVDAQNRIRLRGFDYLTNTQIAFYLLDSPADKTRYTLTPEQQQARSGAPVFPQGVSLCCALTEDSVYVTVPRAESTDGFPVVLYRAWIEDEDGRKTARAYTIPPYWYENRIPAYTIRLPKPKGFFTVHAVAENAYGMTSDALHCAVSEA